MVAPKRYVYLKHGNVTLIRNRIFAVVIKLRILRWIILDYPGGP